MCNLIEVCIMIELQVSNKTILYREMEVFKILEMISKVHSKVCQAVDSDFHRVRCGLMFVDSDLN